MYKKKHCLRIINKNLNGGELNMVSKQLMEVLNRGIARELQVSIQYMWQHVQVTGIESLAVGDVFRRIAIVEMKHAEALAKRLSFLNGVPTTKPDPIFVGSSLVEMLKQDQVNEEEAVRLYKRGIQLANKEGDSSTRLLFESILSAEEEHLDTFGKLLVSKTQPFTQPEI
jgi:bacterioferritin